MPYSFTQIEKEKTKTITFVFSFLIFFYFLTAWLIALVVKNYIAAQAMGRYAGPVAFQWLSLEATLGIFLVAGVVVYLQWLNTVDNLIPKILKSLQAEPLNLNDHYHKKFANIIDEVSVATGGQKIIGAVIATPAMNAFALADYDGRAVIGVTEGLLARLTRAQLEAVVGHEAAHIVSGDCLTTTVTSSLFSLYGAMLKGLEVLISSTRYTGVRYGRGRNSGGGIVLLILIYGSIGLTKVLGTLLGMFISRQKEYRADAVAVRLTRDPLALAEALYAIGYRWRGSDLPAQEMEAIFILNPKYSSLDESSGTVAELFSTHPPIDKRIQILLDMAHSDLGVVAQNVQAQENQVRRVTKVFPDGAARWRVHQDGAWQGPFDLAQMITLGWLKPDTWVQRVGAQDVKKARQDTDLMSGLYPESQETSSMKCPKCQIGLRAIPYEGVEVLECGFCHGVLVDEKNMTRILLRQEIGFNADVVRLGNLILEQANQRITPKIVRDPKTLYQCPSCQHVKARMNRMFYTAAFMVEIDKCLFCGKIWFDAYELEVLQYLVEQANQ